MSLTHIIVIGPHCWGKGKSLQQAVAKARINWHASGSGQMPYVAYAVPADAEVDEMGMIVWDDGSIRIKKVRRVSYEKGKQKVEVLDEIQE